jgi:hypothetical protein
MASAAHHDDPDRDARWRLLRPVAEQLAAAGVASEFVPLERYLDFYAGLPTGTTGLACRHPAAANTVAQVTIVRVKRLLRPGEGGLHPDGRSWVRDLDLDYRLGAAGDLHYEVTLLEDPDDGLGHTRATSAQRRLTDDAQAVVDAVVLWHGYRDTLRCQPPPPPNAKGQARRLRRELDHRNAAAATPAVDVDLDRAVVASLLAQAQAALADDLAALDRQALCWHFPRGGVGRYARAAVVALAGCANDPSKRGPWLTARAHGDRLVVGLEALIGANQPQRWDATRWQWDQRQTATTPAQRWQLDQPDASRAVAALLDAHRLADALAAAGVRVDADLAALLDGYPTRYLRARYTERWVRRLYQELRQAAPWRLAAALGTWQAERHALGRAANQPVVLFRLGGLNQQRRPSVALACPAGIPELRMVWTGSNAVLSRSLWQRPPDLDAALRGWPDTIGARLT